VKDEVSWISELGGIGREENWTSVGFIVDFLVKEKGLRISTSSRVDFS